MLKHLVIIVVIF